MLDSILTVAEQKLVLWLVLGSGLHCFMEMWKESCPDFMFTSTHTLQYL